MKALFTAITDLLLKILSLFDFFGGISMDLIERRRATNNQVDLICVRSAGKAAAGR